MSDGSTIEWLNFPGYKPASWNCIKGCTRKSRGCENCYAEVMAARFSKPGQWGHGIAEMRGGDHRWTGRVELVAQEKVDLPLRWRKPRCIFVNSTSDLFHERLSVAAIHAVFSVMERCPRHVFIALTKRAERMRSYCYAMRPLPNVVLGVSVEDRSTMHRIDDIRATAAACRMISFEPLLEDLGKIDLTGISWAVTGGESGPGARPMHPDWARSIRDQCQAAGVPFFFKQWGEWVPWEEEQIPWVKAQNGAAMDGNLLPDINGMSNAKRWTDALLYEGDGWCIHERVGKHRAGRLLDGRTHDEFPEVCK